MGCKVCLILYIIAQRKSFTLTMWDVKSESAGIYSNWLVKSFTLTMWDVKLDVVIYTHGWYTVLP